MLVILDACVELNLDAFIDIDVVVNEFDKDSIDVTGEDSLARFANPRNISQTCASKLDRP